MESPYPGHQNSLKALYSMVFGPKSLNIGVLRALGLQNPNPAMFLTLPWILGFGALGATWRSLGGPRGPACTV